MSGKIGKDFKRLGLCLDLSYTDLEHVQMDNQHSVQDQICEMLKLWKQKKGSNATLGKLQTAMRDVDIDSSSLFEECLDDKSHL